MEDEKIEQYIKHFEKLLKIEIIKNLDLKNLKLLMILYRNFEQLLCEPTEEEMKFSSKQMSLSKTLFKKFTRDQKKLFLDYESNWSETLSNRNEKFFIYGYLIATELNREIQLNTESKL